jgi:hypothetical protein
MGYERTPLQILGGGFSCLPPPDKIPVTDYLLAQNFRSDAKGRLISRPGYPQVFSYLGTSVAHSMFSAGSGPPYYVGANADMTSGAGGTLYYDGFPQAFGFDGKRIAFAAQNGWTWVMNRGKVGRHQPGGSFENWNLTAPPASPTLAAGSPPPTSASVTYTYNLVGDPSYVHFLTIAGATYSIPENGYAAAQIPLVLSIIANADPNCSVTYDGVSQNIVITPVAPNVLIPVSGSDGNADALLANGAVTSLPTGTYQVYLTFSNADGSLESNPSPASAAIDVTAQTIEVTIPAADTPTDGRVFFVNIYAIGGTMDQAYRVGQVISTPAAPATSFLYSIPDGQAVANGILMPTDNDIPPACSGMIGPHFSRLYAWSTAQHKNRLFWTPVNQPQYWPGAHDEEIGNWVDVGLDDEEIVWCTIHTNLMVLYKERSIWMLIGSDPGSATLEQVYEGLGLVGQFALASAGQIDYFVAPNGLCLFDMSQVHGIQGDILPLFNQKIVNAGPRTPPGNVLPGSAFLSSSASPYAISLGHAMGRLWVSYAENTATGTGYNLLVFDEGPEPERQAFVNPRTGRWFYERHALAGVIGFLGFFFDGTQMIGLTGGANAKGFSLADYRGFLTTDPGTTPIEAVYGSHYENCGLPDNDKQWLEVVIDYEYDAGTNADVYAGFNGGKIAPQKIGELPPATRQSLSFRVGGLPGGADGAFLARSMAVIVDALTTGKLTLHSVHLYYYPEARLGMLASTIPTDLGLAQMKEAKELELDIDSADAVSAVATITSDLPGNALAVRQTITVGKPGRAVLKYPFPTTQGYLWQVLLNSSKTFRLYSARLLMRVLAVAIEGYESAAGFVYDTLEFPLGSGEPSTLYQVRIEMDSDGPTTVEVFTDLPGETQTSKGVYTLTTGATTRSWVLVPLPAGIEGRSVRLKVTGTAAYRIYNIQINQGHIGRYLGGSTASGANDNFRTLEVDLHFERIGMFKRIEVDLAANATVTMTVATDQGTAPIADVFTSGLATPTGRQAVLITLPPGIRGRLLRVSLTGAAPSRIYHIRVWTRPLDPGSADEAIWSWKEFPLETSDVLPTWTNVTSVDDTSNKWEWAPIDLTVSG